MQLMQVSECSTDVQQLVVVVKEEIPAEQNDWIPSLEQQEPALPHVKEEQDELWTNQEGQQLQGLKEDDIAEFTPTFVLVKIEEDEEKPPVSQLHHIQIEENRQDCRGSEPDGIFHPRWYLQKYSNVQAGDSSDTEDSEDWTRSSEPESHFNKKTKPLASTSTNGEEFGVSESAINLVCIKDIKSRATLKPVHPFSMSNCRTINNSLERHIDTTVPNIHSKIKNADFIVRDVGGKTKRHHCSECGKTFTLRSDLKRHMRVHTGEKPFCCSECGTRFTQKSSLDIHMRVHTGEKPFSCSVCKKCFSDKSNFRTHMATHTGKKEFGCLICSKRFSVKSSLDIHTRVHTGEKPFSCSVCKKCFSQKSHVQKHMKIHKRQKINLCVIDDQHNSDNMELGMGDIMEYTVRP